MASIEGYVSSQMTAWINRDHLQSCAVETDEIMEIVCILLAQVSTPNSTSG